MAEHSTNRGLTSFLMLVAALSACGSEPPTVPGPSRGALRVLIRTTGATFDDNGYVLRAGSSDFRLAIQDSFDLRDLQPGPLPLALSDVAANCRILSLPSNVTIQSTQRTRVVVEMSCDSALRNVILFHRDLGRPSLWMMRPDGSEKTLILPTAAQASLTPDGSRILFYDFQTGRLSLIRVDRTRQWVAVPNLVGGQSQADISPDGLAVVFVNTTPGLTGYENAIYRANLDGTDIRRLTDGGSADQWPRWSPDGQRIAFSRYSEFDAPQVFIMDADGGNQRALTPPGEGYHARWSPDGSQLLFENLQSVWRLWTMGSDGANPRPLSEAIDYFGDEAEWSPDGTWLLVYRNGSELWRASLDGTEFTLLAGEGYNFLGRWYR
jgi:Tol biopolymer transport system component